MDLISSIKQAFTHRKYTEAEVERLVRFAKSKQGLKLTAQLMQQTDSLTKKDIATWRQAWQSAISIDNPNRERLYDIYTDCLVDLHLTGCIGQRKGKTLQKDFRLVGKDGKGSGLATSATLRWIAGSGGIALSSWAMWYRMKTGCDSTGWKPYPANTYVPNTELLRQNPPPTGAQAYRTARAISPCGASKWENPKIWVCCSNALPPASARKTCLRSGTCSARYSAHPCA